MNISFQTAELRTICSGLEAAEHKLGAAGARALLAILADMEALDSVNEFVALRGDDVTTLSGDVVEVAVEGEHRAILVPVGARFGRLPDGSPDWTTVQRLKLTALS